MKTVFLYIQKKISQANNVQLSGFLCIIIGLLLTVGTFYPIIIQETKYVIQQHIRTDNTYKKNKKLQPVNPDFSIIIPKIFANSAVIKQVDPANKEIYLKALQEGVAHAKGTPTPDKPGNTFLFAHSTGNWWEMNRYNAVFYLLHKLKKGDIVLLFYKHKKYEFTITHTETVTPDQVEKLTSSVQSPESSTTNNTLTLMTCTPPGTTFKRLLIHAKKTK